jgi:zinc transporter 9
MGVLVGTSLIVIIPEGVETLYSSSLASHQHRWTARSLDVRYVRSIPAVLARGSENLDSAAAPVLPETVPDADDASPTSHAKGGEVRVLDEPKMGNNLPTSHVEPDKTKEGTSSHAWIGVALISGFILMYLIDKLPQFATFSSHQHQRPYHISLDNLGSGLSREISPSRNGGYLDGDGSLRRSHSFATTTGLVIHATADGIALGASTSNTSLSFVIFVAIMVHKAPAAFGLTSVLLRQGLSSRAARGHLLIFSLAAPAGALLTWLFAHTVRTGHVGGEQGTQWRTGMLLLFSAGTFL